MLTPVDMPGADCGDIASASSKKGFVERGRSGRFDETIQQLRAKERDFGRGYWSQNWPLLEKLGVLLVAEML
jgi:hypothetical protein